MQGNEAVGGRDPEQGQGRQSCGQDALNGAARHEERGKRSKRPTMLGERGEWRVYLAKGCVC